MDVEVFSRLPQCRPSGDKLACQREVHDGELDAFDE